MLTKKERIQKYGEVFTPDHVVRDMCDMLEKENQGCYEPERTFLEPTCGDGAFVVEVLRRKFARCKCRTDYTVSLISLYAMEIQADNVQKTIDRVTALCRKYFNPTKAELEIISDHIIQCDSLKVMKLLDKFSGCPALPGKNS